MDTQGEYEAGKSIVHEISEIDWDALRVAQDPWPEENKSWKCFRNYTISELKTLMKTFNDLHRQQGQLYTYLTSYAIF